MGVGVGTCVLNIGRFVSVFFSARYVSAAELGQFFLIQLLCGILITIAGFGTSAGLVKLVADQDESVEKRRIIFAVGNFFVVAFLIIMALATGLNSLCNVVSVTPMVAAFALTQALLQYYSTAIQSLRDFKILSRANVLGGILKAVSVPLIFLNIEPTVQGLFTAMTVTNVIPLFVLMYHLYHGQSRKLVFACDIDCLRENLRFSFPLYLNDLYSILYDRGYALLIAVMMNPAALAYYTIATRLPSVVEDFRRIYTSVFYPTMLELVRKNRSAAAEFLKMSVSSGLSVILAGAALFYFFREEITTLVFSARYREVSLAAFLMMTRAAFTFCGPLMGNTLIALGRNAAPIRINSVVTTVTFALTAIVIPWYGYMGVVWVSLLGEVFGITLNVFYLRSAGILLPVGDLLLPPLVFAITIASLAVNNIFLTIPAVGLFTGFFLWQSHNIFQRFHAYRSTPEATPN